MERCIDDELPFEIPENWLWLSSPLVYEQCRRAATGTAQKTVGLASLKGLLIPIPPLNEQVRILQKLNTLLALAAL